MTDQVRKLMADLYRTGHGQQAHTIVGEDKAKWILAQFSSDHLLRTLLREWLKGCPNPPEWHWSFDLNIRTVRALEHQSVETPQPTQNMRSDEWWQAELDRCIRIEGDKYRALFDAYSELKAGDADITAGIRPTHHEVTDASGVIRGGMVAGAPPDYKATDLRTEQIMQEWAVGRLAPK